MLKRDNMPQLDKKKESMVKMTKTFKRTVNPSGIVNFSCSHKDGMTRKAAREHFLKVHKTHNYGNR